MFEGLTKFGRPCIFRVSPDMFGDEIGLLFATADKGGGGGGRRRAKKDDDDDDDDDQDDEPAPRRRDPGVTAAKYGADPQAMARHIDELESDNFKYRNTIRRQKNRINSLEADLPEEGTVVLTAEQAKDWEEYVKLGKPADLSTLSQKVSTLEATNAKNEREQLLRDVADAPAAGKKFDLDVFKDLDSKIPGITYEKKEIVEGEGNKRTAWVARYKEGEGDAATQKETEVIKLFSEKFPKYMGSLVSSGGTNPTGDLSGNEEPFVWPEQPGGGNGGGGSNLPSPTDAIFNSRYGHAIPKAQ